MTIQEYIANKLLENTTYEVTKILGVSQPMVSAYRNQGYNPSLKVAIRVYLNDGVVLLPYSKEGLEIEAEKTR